jgi:hypothetical protein
MKAKLKYKVIANKSYIGDVLELVLNEDSDYVLIEIKEVQEYIILVFKLNN